MAVDFDGERMLNTEQKPPKATAHPQRPWCEWSGYSCNKLFLFIYAVLYLFVGTGLLSVGLWVELQRQDYEAVNNDLFIPVIFLICVGFCIAVNAVFGIVGVVKENTCLLKTFLVMTVTCFLAQVTIGILVFIYRQEIPAIVSSSLMFLVRGYAANNDYMFTMDNLQSNFQCCGFESYRDYEESKEFSCGSKTPMSCGVPWTCCKYDGGSELRLKCGYDVRWNNTVPEDKINTMGCTDKFLAWLTLQMDIVGACALGTAIPQIIGILLVYYFIGRVWHMKVWYRVGM
ncbi:hypothetical protein CHS0354_039196 [Potamilus streckersoni]|uniref:Tetraspanin n=1 Tax=Potamilus streckersoni TaxID=2493646 RepID=A0AAE0TD31_9BIVA|nr:hypothetical protein CHS0354_039196 [Potamilus streckersoni]